MPPQGLHAAGQWICRVSLPSYGRRNLLGRNIVGAVDDLLNKAGFLGCYSLFFIDAGGANGRKSSVHRDVLNIVYLASSRVLGSVVDGNGANGRGLCLRAGRCSFGQGKILRPWRFCGVPNNSGLSCPGEDEGDDGQSGYGGYHQRPRRCQVSLCIVKEGDEGIWWRWRKEEISRYPRRGAKENVTVAGAEGISNYLGWSFAVEAAEVSYASAGGTFRCSFHSLPSTDEHGEGRSFAEGLAGQPTKDVQTLGSSEEGIFEDGVATCAAADSKTEPVSEGLACACGWREDVERDCGPNQTVGRRSELVATGAPRS